MEAWLKCEKVAEVNGNLEVSVQLQDESTTTIQVHPTLTDTDEQGNLYVKVDTNGKKEKLVYITLPKPSLQHGCNITVKESQLRGPETEIVTKIITQRKR